MEFKVEMEDGTMELVADTHFSDDCFRVHQWGDVWLVATLNDDTKLVDEKGQSMTMGDLRELDAGVTTFLKTGGEARRCRTFANRKGVNKQARPFNKTEK